MLTPESGEFKHFDLGGTYANVGGQNGDQWFTSFRLDGPIAKVSKDGVLSKYPPPTSTLPQPSPRATTSVRNFADLGSVIPCYLD